MDNPYDKTNKNLNNENKNLIKKNKRNLKKTRKKSFFVNFFRFLKVDFLNRHIKKTFDGNYIFFFFPKFCCFYSFTWRLYARFSI